MRFLNNLLRQLLGLNPEPKLVPVPVRAYDPRNKTSSTLGPVINRQPHTTISVSSHEMR